jgi:group II intron reverse transcriptase/maturase
MQSVSKGGDEESSLSEKPGRRRPRRLADWLNPTGERKVHSLVDKIYKRKNLEVAWEKVKRNRGAGGIDGEDIAVFEARLEEQLERLHGELRDDTYAPQPVMRQLIPKAGQPGKHRALGIPTIYDRVCQQAILNRLEPIFDGVFDEASFGYRKGRSTKDALRKVWCELEQGNEWVVDADLRDFFGSVDHEKLLTLVNQRVSDGRVLGLLEQILQAGCVAEGKRLATEQGTPQGGVVSPLLSNILLTPFDREMRRKGYRLTRYADDWLVTCKSRREAQAALAAAQRILVQLGVTLHAGKTRIVHVRHGFEFLGYKVKRGSRPFKLAASKIRSGVRGGDLYAYPRAKSIQHFKDQIRARTRRKAPVSTRALIDQINPIIRGWGHYYCKAHVRKLFARLARWIVRRLWSQRYKRWRNCGWRYLPERRLYGEYGLVNLIALIPSLNPRATSL